MEHIAVALNKPPLEVRMNNMDAVANAEIRKYVQKLRQGSDYDNRLKEVEKFNQARNIFRYCCNVNS